MHKVANLSSPKSAVHCRTATAASHVNSMIAMRMDGAGFFRPHRLARTEDLPRF
jgi:hypothetical protein